MWVWTASQPLIQKLMPLTVDSGRTAVQRGHKKDRGLQSVRSLGPSRARTLVMARHTLKMLKGLSLEGLAQMQATIDEPPPGPHLYRTRAALTTGDEWGPRLRHIMQNDTALEHARLHPLSRS